MKLNEKEKAICDKYGTPDEKGFVHCDECPLSIEPVICKASVPAEEWYRLKKIADFSR